MQTIDDLVDDIPVTLVLPDKPDGSLVLWLSHLGGSAAKERPTMTRLAEAGHPVVSFDPPLHGRRAVDDDPWAFAQRVLAGYRQRFWPILGRATLDALRVITWAQETVDTGQVFAGGVSMGGDIALAVAGIDDRIGRVAAIGSTPNWSRPNMHAVDDPDRLIVQGVADRYAQWFADHLDPRRHLDRYTRNIAISLSYGTDDRHIPAVDGLEFREALAAIDVGAGEQVQVTEHPGLDHFGVTTDDGAIAAALDWLSDDAPRTA